MPLRRAKIVCTLGPSVDAPGAIESLVEAGMDVARLNFSHGDAKEHARRAERVRSASRAAGRPVALLQDLGGPKVRTVGTGPGVVAAGETLLLTAASNGPGGAGADRVLTLDYDGLHRDVAPGDRILLADGHVELRVLAIEGERVRCRVEHGGALRPRMGVNLPSQQLSLPALTDKDRADVEHGFAIGVDYVALSFVRHADDVKELRRLCQSRGHPTPIVAKIETPGAVERLDSIVQEADAIMVARGDLGVELPLERVPVVQKMILAAGRVHQKPVIVATEMLHSMIEAPRPTRAEASDVAGAVFGGADALMLSGETASGRHPLEACRTMDRIIREVETSQFFGPAPSTQGSSPPEAIARAACQLAEYVSARAVVALTESGSTARLVSKGRPVVPIVAFSPDDKTLSRLALLWGVYPSPLEVVTDIDELARRAGRLLAERALLSRGERFVLVYGAPLGSGGATNAVRVEELGA
jgi:pyruvate kinase